MNVLNNKKCFLILLLSSLCALGLSAQGQHGSIRKDIQMGSFNTNSQLHITRPVYNTNKNTKKAPDYVLYRNIIRRNLWLEGQGKPITQETANHLPCYFRLSMKNKKGHYQFVEALKGNDLTSDHTVSPYIKDKRVLSPEDTIINEWDKRFSTVGQWLMASDLTGEHVVEERAYEAKSNNANLIYAFQPIYNDDTHITGSYTDSWGLPIDIDDSDDHNYGSVVYITLNQQGLDSIVDHIDAKGLCRYNEYGVDQTRYSYDKKDRLVSVSSHNTIDDRVNDNRGFCATLYEYDDKEGSCTITHVDKNLTPVTPVYSATGNIFKKAKIKFDPVGRKSTLNIIE